VRCSLLLFSEALIKIDNQNLKWVDKFKLLSLEVEEIVAL
jgi:hypothetical protein